MALVVKDRVKETTATTGTGTLTLAGADTGFQSFSTALSDGDTTYYSLVELSTGEWEVGLGTFTATGTTLARTTILASSNSGSAINLTAGEASVFITQPAGKAAYFDGSGDLILNQDPTSNLQAATKQYVDTIAAAGLHYHPPVRVEEPSNLTVTYDNGTSGVGATLTNAGTQAALVLDNVTMVVSDRVLIANQTNQAHNGVYTVTNIGSASTNWVLTRATDADSYGPSDPNALGEGDAFFIKEGDTNAGHLDVMTTSGEIIFGTTNIVFSEVAETTVYSAGDGLTLTGTSFAVGAGTGVTVNANDVAIGQSVGTGDNVTFNQVTAALVGNVTGDVTGNAATATALQTGRTISLTGDVTGTSGTFDGTGNVSIAATIAADSVALGTDTTGNYVATGAVSGNGLSGSASAEGATFTVTSNATNANTASTIVFRDGSGNFSAGTITANLTGTASFATDAGTLDSLDSTQFLRSDTADTFSGATLTFDNTTAKFLEYSGSASGPYLQLTTSGTANGYLQATSAGNVYLWNSRNNTGLNIYTDFLWYNGSSYETIWRSGNDGSGSGLDADTVDGIQASSFLRSDTSDTASGTITFSSGSGIYIDQAQLYHDTSATYRTLTVKNQGDADEVTIDGRSSDGTQRFAVYGDSTASGFLNPTNNSWKLKLPNSGSFTRDNTYTIWDSGNDGSGSGLDADLWDGNQFSSYLNQAVLTTSSPTFAELYTNGWFRNNTSGKGLYNQATTQHFYSDDDDWWNVAGGTSANGIRFRDDWAGTVRGSVYADINNNVGILDAGGSWAIRHINDNGTYFYTDNTTEEFRVGRDVVTGGYGTVQTSTTRNGWGGYSINGQYVFMSNHGDYCGIYNDVDDEWMFYAQRNGPTYMYYDGSAKLTTNSSGVTVTGTCTATSFSGDGSGLTNLPAATGISTSGAVTVESTGSTVDIDAATRLTLTASDSTLAEYHDLTGAGQYARVQWRCGSGNRTYVEFSSSRHNQVFYYSEYRDLFNIAGNTWGWRVDYTMNPLTGNYLGYMVHSYQGIQMYTTIRMASDINLKTDIAKIDNPIEKLSHLNGYTFTWKNTKQKDAGVIAQEVQQVLPELVNKAEGFEDESLTVNYNGLIGYLIEVVKDQQKQIDALKEKVGM